MTVESTASRPTPGLFSPFSIMATSTETSMTVTLRVRISVPKGWPIRDEMPSA